MGELSLRPLTVHDEAQARAAHEELAADGFGFLLAQRREEGAAPESWAEYVARLEDQRHGRRLDPGFVPASFLVAEVDGVIVGRASVRHELNEFLAVWGGHIGYGVRPAYRRRGHATAILRGCLALCADLGIERALVTCDLDNTASAATIERCGGVLDPDLPVAEATEAVSAKRRYWVPTA